MRARHRTASLSSSLTASLSLFVSVRCLRGSSTRGVRCRALFCLILAGSTACLQFGSALAQEPPPAAPLAPAAPPAPAAPAAAHPPSAGAKTEGHDVNDLSKQTQNPVADLVSMPFQFNFNNGGALRDQTQ